MMANARGFSIASWVLIAKEAKKAVSGPPSSEGLQELVTKIHCVSVEVKQAYEDLRRYIPPDGETRRRVYTCDAVFRLILEHAWDHLKEKHKEQDFHKKTGTLDWDCLSFLIYSISVMKFNHQIKTFKPVLCKEAASNLAVTQATMKVLQEIECEKQELANL